MEQRTVILGVDVAGIDISMRKMPLTTICHVGLSTPKLGQFSQENDDTETMTTMNDYEILDCSMVFPTFWDNPQVRYHWVRSTA